MGLWHFKLVYVVRLLGMCWEKRRLGRTTFFISDHQKRLCYFNQRKFTILNGGLQEPRISTTGSLIASNTHSIVFILPEHHFQQNNANNLNNEKICWNLQNMARSYLLRTMLQRPYSVINTFCSL